MKKTLFLTALAGFAALLCLSCNKPDNGGDTPKDIDVVFEEPAYLDQAAVVTFPSTGTSLNVDKQKLVKPEKLLLMESGHYVFMGKLVGSASYAPTKAGDDIFIRSGKYTISNNVYTLDGFGKAEISNGKIYIDMGGNPVSYDVNVNHPSAPSAGVESNLVRGWKPSGKVKISIPSKGISTNIEPSLDAVAAYLQEHGVSINKEDYAGYQVAFISLSLADNTFTLGFTNKEAYVGTWKWADKNAGKFTYSFQQAYGSELINGSAAGTVKFYKEGSANKCDFVMEISAKGVSANLEFALVETK